LGDAGEVDKLLRLLTHRKYGRRVALLVAILIVFVIGSLLLILFAKKEVLVDIGKSLLTGAVLSFAILFLQIHLDHQRRAEQKEEQFRFSIGFAQDLNGLEPEFSLAGMYLSGKNMNYAELKGQDLNDTNLQQVSLRSADLEDADLEGANLYGADLAGASAIGANFRHADLRAAKLHLASMTLPVDAGDFVGTKVNSRTCWPDDYLAELHAPGFSKLRHALQPQPTEERGRTVIDESSPRAYGRACGLADENVWDDLGLYGEMHVDLVRAEELRQTAHRLALTFGTSVEDLRLRFSHAGPIASLGEAAPAVQARVCAGDRRVAARRADLSGQGWTGWIVKRPGQGPAKAVFIREPEGEAGEPYEVEFGKPLEPGTLIRVIVEEPSLKPQKRELQRRVRRCQPR
jgi:pentapeptide repeat protein